MSVDVIAEPDRSICCRVLPEAQSEAHRDEGVVVFIYLRYGIDLLSSCLSLMSCTS